MRPLKEKVSLTLDSDLIAIMKQEAENDERSFSQYINLILRNHLVNKVKTDTIEELEGMK